MIVRVTKIQINVKKKIINAYDVWGSKTVFGKTYDDLIRTTFVIDENRKIEKIIRDVKAKMHTEQILETNLVTQ